MKNKVLLPSHLIPERYRLTVKPYLGDFTFEGEEIIYLELQKPANVITLHAKELKVWGVEFKVSQPHPSSAKAAANKQGYAGQANVKFQSKKIQYDTKAETVTFVFDKKLPKGKGELSLKFKGILNDQMRGFYRSRYMHEGEEKHLATTQFEATDARRAFPCFDEPHQKAVFDVTIMVPQGLTAISNTIESSVKEHESGYKVVEFAPTPKMSTYLLAFIVGDFEYIEQKTKNGVLVRVFTTPGKKHQAKFALECGVKMLDFYEKYFDIPYPLPVLDLIAIPDFSSGAMENWGAVTYRETALLVDPQHSSSASKQWVALVIAHELAHQWFGNLVTMHWWTDLWLNEGFASYIEYLAVDHVFPEWDIWTQFAYADMGVALKLDALNTTHAIEIEVKHPDEIGEIFDEVSYSKGASVIRMLADYLGEKDFRNGLVYYLKKHAYKNTKTTDLWEALEKVSKKPVRQIMENWTKKPGHPVLQVVEKPEGLELKQSRFFSSAISKRKFKDATLWSIPVAVRTNKSDKTQKLVLNKKSGILPLKKYSWVKINSGESGFFRTDYPSQMLQQLHSAIKEKKLSPIDRLGMVRDAFALAESQQLPTAQALNLIQNYKEETDYTVWTEIAAGLGTLDHLLFNEKFYPKFQEFAQKVFEPLAKKIGWDKTKGESHTKGLLRSLILSELGGYGHVPTIEHAQKLFNAGKVISPDIRGVVYTLVAENGGQTEYKKFVKMYKAENLHEEKNRIGRAMANFKQPEILKQVLEFSISKDVRLQDMPLMFAVAAINPYGQKLAWNFLKKNWKKINKLFPPGSHMITRLVKPFSLCNTEKEFKDIKSFFFKVNVSGAKRTVTQVLERVESNILWLKNQRGGIKRWLGERKA